MLDITETLHQVRRHMLVWRITAVNALQEAFINRWSNLLFFTGKAIRLAMSLLFLFLIRGQVESFAQYTTDQVIVFFLTYQLIDLMAQIAYRGVYEFSSLIRDGNFDFYLAKPISPLFRALTGKPDINDAVFFIPNLIVAGLVLAQLDISITLTSAVWYGVLLVNSFLIATGFHILVLATGVFTTQIDGIVWLYRDLSRLGRFPVTIYPELLRLSLFFLVPIGFMITVPAQVLIQTDPTYSIAITGAFGVGFLLVSLRIWEWSVRHYSSASS